MHLAPESDCRCIAIFSLVHLMWHVVNICWHWKHRAWNAWMKYAVDETFISLGNLQGLTLHDKTVSDRLVAICLLDVWSNNDCELCRRILFTKKNRAIQNIPPTLDALIQHTKRAALQTFIWNKCLKRAPLKTSPAEWGWKSIQYGFEPVWTTLSSVSNHCDKLVSYSCKKRWSIRKCVKQNLPCSQLCACEGHCSRDDL